MCKDKEKIEALEKRVEELKGVAKEWQESCIENMNTHAEEIEKYVGEIQAEHEMRKSQIERAEALEEKVEMLAENRNEYVEAFTKETLMHHEAVERAEALEKRVDTLELKILSDLVPCDQCSGKLSLDDDGDWVCSQCGLSEKDRRNEQ